MQAQRFMLPLLLCVAGSAGCGGPKDIRLDQLGVSVTAPDGWSVEMGREGSLGEGGADLKKNGKTYGFLSVGVIIPLGANAKAWPKEGEHTLQHLEAAFAGLDPSVPETFSNGFGLRYRKKDKPYFAYVIKVGDRELSCRPNDWIPEEDVPAAIEICKSVRP